MTSEPDLMNEAPALEARDLTKRFPGVLANDRVSLSINKGEILGLLGENGAGKSTLVKMLFGVYSADEGEVWMDGERVQIDGPGDAIDRGMGMVHQHFQLVGPLSVAENIVLGAEPTSNGFVKSADAERDVQALSDRFGLSVDPRAIVEDLPVGIQQRVEILKALYRGAEILILDEPTAVLTPQETDELLQVLRDLAASGVSIIFITHKLREILAITDRVVVLRGGAVVGQAQTEGASQQSLAEMMVGRSVVLSIDKGTSTVSEIVLEVNDLTVRDDRGQAAVKSLGLTVRGGEIVGVAGVEGNGQRELVEAITGLRHPRSGSISVDGAVTTRSSPRAINDMGVAHIPEDREKDGLVGSYSISDNLVLNRYREAPFASFGRRQFAAVAENARDLVERFQVATPGISTKVDALSGGNKQKVIVARELSTDNKLIVASQPTRGVDVGSIEFIHQQLVNERDAGAGVLLVSAELDEIFSLSDRILVIYEGTIVADLDAATATREQVGLLMSGVVE